MEYRRYVAEEGPTVATAADVHVLVHIAATDTDRKYPPSRKRDVNVWEIENLKRAIYLDPKEHC